MKRTRDERRKYKALAIERAKRIIDYSSHFNYDIKQIHKRADNMQVCSRFCCGNPRRWAKGKERLTLQERRFNDGIELPG